jgi:UTP--glucose-1-phosphate uridylyltransferase
MPGKHAIKKAVIPVAGFGTRRLPITKAVEKCMLPVGDRPVIDYVVEDCLQAGIEEIIFVVGEDFQQLRRYYGPNILLENYLADRGKKAELREVQKLATKARFRYVIQDQHQPYGTAVPVWLARYLVKPEERMLVVFGDQFFYRPDGSSEIAGFIRAANKAKTPAAMLVNEVPWKEVHHYGVVVTEKQGPVELFKNIVEKPARQEAPSNLNNASCFIFDHNIFPFLEQNVNREQTGEHQLTDALNAYVHAGNDLAVIRAAGEFLDCGNTSGWLHANNRILAFKQ